MFGKKEAPRETSGPSLSATDEPVAEIRIVGNKTIPTTQILNELQTRVGRPFDPALVQRDVRKLNSRGWFINVQPSYEQDAKGRVVIFKVMERPVIRYVEYLGNKGIRTKKLVKETELKVGGPVDPYAVQEARRKLLDLYRRNGFNNVQITILEGDEPTHQGVVFVINEGRSQKVWDVEFIGNKFVSGRRLKTQVQSKPPLMMVFKGYVDQETIEGDVQRLTAYYRAFGFFQAKVGRQLVFNEKGNWLTLRFVIHEGPRYQVEEVAFMGNKLFASQSLAMGTELLAGQPFEQAKMNSDVEWLKELYGSQGYVFADIRADPIFSEEAGKLKLMYHIEEGKRWRVGNVHVHISGDNPHTKIQTALNRITVRPGEIIDIREIRASERRLQASSLFMTDPVRGVMPKITFHIKDLDETEIAQSAPGYRGQSPDDVSTEQGIRSGEQRMATDGQGVRRSEPVAVSTEYGVLSTRFRNAAQSPTQHSSGLETGQPPIAPPSMLPQVRTAEPPTTFVVQSPAGVAPDEQIDIHLYIEDEHTAVETSSDSKQTLSPTAVIHEVRRSPIVESSTPASRVPTTRPVASGWSRAVQAYRPYHYAEGGSSPANPYQNLTVRTQSPYQPATTTAQAASAGQVAPAYYQQPAAAPAAGTVQQAYGANSANLQSAYGGQTLGATGPDAAPVGNSPYAVHQTAITEPQLPPSNSSAAPFGPPPMTGAPPAEFASPQPTQFATPPPQYASPPPQFGPPPIYSSGRPLTPDPNITPIAPLTTHPESYPNVPLDSFTPMITDPLVDLDVVVSEAQTGRLMLGVAVNSDAGLVGQILIDEQNFDWTRFPTSWDDFASGRAWRGAGQRFRIEAAPGTEVQRYLVSFQEPYFMDTPVSLGLSGSFFDRRYIDYDEQRIGGRVALGYAWTENDLSANIAYRGENVGIRNVSDPTLPELAEVVGSNALHGFKLTVSTLR